MLGAITNRGEAQVLRLALVYTLVDGRNAIATKHLKAAFAVWRYCKASARAIFGKTLGDKVADRIWGALEHNPDGLSRDQMYRELFSGNVNESRISLALGLLERLGMAFAVHRKSKKGRPVERWFANVAQGTPKTPKEKNE